MKSQKRNANVLAGILRLKRYSEDLARVDLVNAEQEAVVREQRLADTEESVVRSRDYCDQTDPAQIAQHHSYVLKMEMQRRGQANSLVKQKRLVNQKRGALRKAVTESRVVSRLSELRDELERSEQQRAEGKALDQLGAFAWARR